jgi:hypothetical protein
MDFIDFCFAVLAVAVAYSCGDALLRSAGIVLSMAGVF